MVVNSAGDGRLKYSTEPNDADEAQFPDGFPTIDAGSVITIGDLVSGTFAQFQDREFEMPLSPMNGSSASGEVKYEADGPEREFELRADNVASGSYDLIVDGVVVDTIQVTSGRVRIEYKDEDDGSTFPENFPDIDVGSTIELEGVLNGQF